MSKTTTALLVKFLLTFVAAIIAFTALNRNMWGWVLLVAIIGTILNYLIGDLMVLPRYGNIVASLGDGVLAALVAYIVDLNTILFNTTWGSLVLFGIIVAVAEYFSIFTFSDRTRLPHKKQVKYKQILQPLVLPKDAPGVFF